MGTQNDMQQELVPKVRNILHRVQNAMAGARTFGTRCARLALKQRQPNLLGIAIVAAILDISATIAGHIGISLPGPGVQAPGAGIGLMILGTPQSIHPYSWEAIVPCITLALMALAGIRLLRQWPAQCSRSGS